MSASPSFPPPLEPLQVIPVYATPATARSRPGIITALGVTAIVAASISIFASGTVGLIALGMMIQTQVAKTITAANARTTTTQVKVGPGNVTIRATGSVSGANVAAPSTPSPSRFKTGPRGIDETLRLTASDALSRAQRLSEKQSERLDQLLAKAGKDIFPFGISTETMASAVSESGTLTSGSDLANYYMIPSGKLEIHDDRAIFEPTDGTQVVRVRADDPAEDDDSGVLKPEQIDSLIAAAQQQTGNKLTTAQVEALKRELSDPEQQLVTPGAANRGAPMIFASMLPDNVVSISASGGFIMLDANGNVTSSSAQVVTAMSNFSVRGAASAMTLLDAILSIALSIFLLIAGILVLRQHRRGRGLLMSYAVLKIPVAVLAAIGWMWTIADVNAGTISPGLVQFWLWMFLAMGLAYPVILLIVLQTRTVREYYNSVRSA